MIPQFNKKTIIAIATLLTLISPVTADTIEKKGNGTFITEDFSCEVALADVAELQRALEITPRTDFKYKVFLEEYEAVTEALKNHSECKGVE